VSFGRASVRRTAHRPGVLPGGAVQVSAPSLRGEVEDPVPRSPPLGVREAASPGPPLPTGVQAKARRPPLARDLGRQRVDCAAPAALILLFPELPPFLFGCTQLVSNRFEGGNTLNEGVTHLKTQEFLPTWFPACG